MPGAKRDEELDKALKRYVAGDVYPFHMPGHKRNALDFPNPYTMDITEINGFDDLHRPNGILKEAQERAARLYGAGKSYFLVNGSTCGILTAVSAASPPKGKLLMARNAHKSVYHAAYLRGLSVEYINPCMTKFGISGAVQPGEVRKCLEKEQDIRGVVITSPTYEGIVSDVASIAETVHEFGIPLIVDEAHGAHFGFHDAFPETAVRLGADAVIQSLHKTLPSFTQTALLHLNSDYILPETIERYLDIYQTSSPSYVLMAGIEQCIRLLREEGKERFERYAANLHTFYQKAEGLFHLHVMRKEDFTDQEIYDLDISKIVISAKQTEMTGRDLERKLREEYHLQMEMQSGFYVLGMTGIMDTPEGFERLCAALKETDEGLSSVPDEEAEDTARLIRNLYTIREKRMEMHEATELPAKTVSLEEAIGEVSADLLSLYPPGIPILLPGEAIEEDFIKNIRKSLKMRLNLQGNADIINGRINIVKKEGI